MGRAWVRCCIHPSTQEPWLLGLAGGTADFSPGNGGGGGGVGDEFTTDHIPISSAHYHQHTPFTSTPPSPPFLRCLVTPVVYCSSLHRGGEKKRLQPTTTMSQGPLCLLCLPAPPAAQYSCGSVPDPDQLGSQPFQSQEEDCVKALQHSYSLCISWITLTLTTTAKATGGAEEILFWDGYGTSGPGTSAAPGAHPAEPGTNSHPGWMPIGLPVLFCHAAVPGTQWHNQHPAACFARERERDRDVSTMCTCSACSSEWAWVCQMCSHALMLVVSQAWFSQFVFTLCCH